VELTRASQRATQYAEWRKAGILRYDGSAGHPACLRATHRQAGFLPLPPGRRRSLKGELNQQDRNSEVETRVIYD